MRTFVASKTRIFVTVAVGLLAGGCSGGTLDGAAGFVNSAIEEPLQAIGITSEEKEPIDYRPRSPLVMPASADLPGPEQDADVAVASPEWPNDPDLLAARLEAEEKERERRVMQRNDDNDDQTMAPDELDDWTRRTGFRTGSGGGEQVYTTRRDGDSFVSPEELKSRREVDTGYQEPARRSLIDPPPGYRVPSPDASMPDDEMEQPEGERGWLARSLGL